MPPTYSDTRERILALERIIQKIRRMTVPHMIEELWRSYGIIAKRKTVEADLDALSSFLPIVEEESYGTLYFRLLSDDELRRGMKDESNSEQAAGQAQL